MGAVALIYTTPWDNYLIMRGVWSYPEGMVLGTLGYVPVEEYGFMIMQTLIAGTLWSMNLPKNNQAGLSFSAKGLLLALAIGIFGSYCLTLESGTYAGLILVWAFPPLALQWSLGARALRESLKSWVPLWVGFTLYLCLADSFAISQGIWSLTLSTRSGWELGNLPVEEALFFALTNLFVLQGLSLWRAWKISSL
jgi:lycopene cyclase domain-containing protein